MVPVPRVRGAAVARDHEVVNRHRQSPLTGITSSSARTGCGKRVRFAGIRPAMADNLNRTGFDGGSFYWIPTPAGLVCWAA
jgi:hypothetical protein